MAVGRLRRNGGYTVIEVVVVMAIVGIVLTPIASSFASASRAQVSQVRRADANSQARLALQRMRVDIHCAHATTLPVQQNSYGGFTLTLPETPGQCPGVVPASSGVSGIEWCTIPYPGSTTRFQLYRYNATALAECSGGEGSTFSADYIAETPSGWPSNSATNPPPDSWAGNIWPSSDTCTAGNLPTIGIDINVAVDPDNAPNDRYEMVDRIAALNSDPC